MPASISVIVSTYDNTRSLAVCLNALARQKDKDFEIIVAQDGNFPATSALIKDFQKKTGLTVHHTSQADEGFRAARSRNLGIHQAQAPYLVFIDGDCFVLPDFIIKHKKLAQQGCFVTGKRSYLRQALTQRILQAGCPPHSHRLLWLVRAAINQCTRFSEFFDLPDAAWRHKKALSWEKAQTCNLAVWRSDIDKINGFDNRYIGHGLEDSDFIARLIHAGVTRKCGDHACLVLHLEHPRQSRSEGSPNAKLFEETLANKCKEARNGLRQAQHTDTP